MIKNIVFDMGKVLMDYSADPVCFHYIKNEEERRQVCEAVFHSGEWLLLDMGLITEEEAEKQICGRLPQHLHESVGLCLRDWDQFNMKRIREMDPILRELKKRGFRLYVCSNASIRLTRIWKDRLPAADCLDGVLFSAEVKCMKPQIEMYQHLFQRFGLNPRECFFIDDMPQNIESARSCGMDGYCYKDGDIEKLKAVLEAIR